MYSVNASHHNFYFLTNIISQEDYCNGRNKTNKITTLTEMSFGDHDTQVIWYLYLLRTDLICLITVRQLQIQY